MADQDALDIQIERLSRTACHGCGGVVDVSQAEPLSAVECPKCGAKFTVPGKLGDVLLLRVLGSGAMGTTFKGHEQSLGRTVAVKAMHHSLAGDRKVVADFLKEARTLASLDHPNVVRVYSLQSVPQPYIVMELLAGGPLERQLARGKPLDERKTLSIALATTKALQAAHEIGLIHGDVKPANIMLDEKGTAKLVDFGMARFGGGRLGEDDAFGTPYYVSPEQVRRGSIDHRTDIYCLGATLFHALAGRPPFAGKQAKEVLEARLDAPPPDLIQARGKLHLETAQVVARMMHPDPDRRYQTYDDLLEELWQAYEAAGGVRAIEATADKSRRPAVSAPGASTPPAHARTVPPSVPPVAAKSSRRLLWIGGGIGAVIVLVVTALVLFRPKTPAPKSPGSSAAAPAAAQRRRRVETPVIDPPGQTLKAPLDVKVTCATEGATVHYTRNGSDPDEYSPAAKGTIRVQPGDEVRVIAYAQGMEHSPLATATFRRDEAALAKVIEVKTSAEQAFESVRDYPTGQGLGAKIAEIRALYATGEELYQQGEYEQAHVRYRKLLEACRTLEKLGQQRERAMLAREDARTALAAVTDTRAKSDPASDWSTATGTAKKASEAFEAGRFDEALQLWQAAAATASKQNTALAAEAKADYEQAATRYDLARLRARGGQPWQTLQKALTGARAAHEAKKFSEAARLYRQAKELLPAAEAVAKDRDLDARIAEILSQVRDAMKEGKLLEAETIVEKALALRGGSDAAWRTKNNILKRRRFRVELSSDRRHSTPLALAWIPAGSFVIGTPPNEAAREAYEKAFTVTLSKPVYMSVHEITKKQFARFVTEHGKDYKTAAERLKKAFSYEGGRRILVRDRSWRNPGFRQGDDHPVVCVTYKEAQAFCTWAGRNTGLTVRLPTEAEWEYACRAGTRTAYNFGDAAGELAKHANFADGQLIPRVRADDGHKFTAPVGQYPPTPWGLRDMHGNVWEWCSDWFGPYRRNPGTDPTGPPKGMRRVVRGGGWESPSDKCRCDERESYSPLHPSTWIGFRVVATGADAKLFQKDKRWLAYPPLPPEPDIHLADLTPQAGKPRINKSVRNKPLGLDGKTYPRGLGTQAPANIAYACRADYKRLVAVAGLDNDVRNDGRAGIVCEVYADETRLARSPLLQRDGPTYWHFDVAIPPGTRRVRLVVTGRSGGRYNNNVCDWVRVGFRTSK